jgi:hypothetical protein
MFNHFVWDVGEFNSHVLRSFHQHIQIKIFDVHHETFCIWSGDDAVGKYLEKDHVRCWCSAG